MTVSFLPISSDEIRLGFEEFYEEGREFFQILKDDSTIGFYGIYDECNGSAQISVHFNENKRYEINKTVALKCLTFPFSLGFEKVLIWTELEKMCRFLHKMCKYGVSYITTEENSIHWFEVKHGT